MFRRRVKTSPSKKITMLGAHFVISSPEDPPTAPLIPPPQSWEMNTTSTTTYSSSAASLVEFSAQYSLLHAATAIRTQTKSEAKQQIKSPTQNKHETRSN